MKRIILPYHSDFCHVLEIEQQSLEDDLVVLTREQTLALRDQLDEILGDRESDEHAGEPPSDGETAILSVLSAWADRQSDNDLADISPEAMEVLARRAWRAVAPFVEAKPRSTPISQEPPFELKSAVSAALRHGLAMVYGRSGTESEAIVGYILDAVNPFVRAPEPSPDLKEAIGRALRSYVTRCDTDALAAPGAALWEVLGADEKGGGELDYLADHLAEAVETVDPVCEACQLRLSQHGIVNHPFAPAAEVDLEPNDPKALASTRGSSSVEAETEDMESRVLRVLIREVRTVEPLTYLAREIVAALPPSLTPEEADAIRLCARAAHAYAGHLVALEERRVQDAADLVFRVVDRLSGSPGSPESDDPRGTTGSKGEGTGVAAFDPHDQEAVCDAIIDLGARIKGLEDSDAWRLASNAHDRIAKLEDWRRSCRHLPKDDEELSGVIAEAMERALRPVARRMSDLESIKINLQARVQTLELHAKGLTDGQAEMASSRPSDDQVIEIYRQATDDYESMGSERRAEIVHLVRRVLAAPDDEAAGQVLRAFGWEHEDLTAVAGEIRSLVP